MREQKQVYHLWFLSQPHSSMFLLQTNMNREGKVETVKSDAKSGGWVSYSAKLKMGPHDQISCQY